MKFIQQLFIVFVIIYVVLPKACFVPHSPKKTLQPCKMKNFAAEGEEIEKAENTEEEDKEEKDDHEDKTMSSMTKTLFPPHFDDSFFRSYCFFSEALLSTYPESTTPPPKIS